MTQNEFANLMATITARIEGRPLDAALEAASQCDVSRQMARRTARSSTAAATASPRAGCAAASTRGIKYGRVVKPGPATHGFSVDVVEMDNVAGGHHRHPQRRDRPDHADRRRRRGSTAAARVGWYTDRAPRTCRPSPAARRSCSTCCPKARSNSRRRKKRDAGAATPLFAHHGRSTMPSLSKADHRPDSAAGRDPARLQRRARSDRAQPRRRARGQDAYHRRSGRVHVRRARRARESLRECARSALGLQPEQRVLLCLHDTIDFPAAFLGASRPASCRSPATRCSRPRTTTTCCATAARAR